MREAMGLLQTIDDDCDVDDFDVIWARLRQREALERPGTRDRMAEPFLIGTDGAGAWQNCCCAHLPLTREWPKSSQTRALLGFGAQVGPALSLRGRRRTNPRHLDPNGIRM